MLESFAFIDKLETQFANNLPFVAYAKPNALDVVALLQQDDILNEVRDFTESGFVFAPFNSEDITVLLPSDITTKLTTKRADIDNKSIFKNKVGVQSDYISKKNHIDLVNKGIDAIHENKFSKVVLSRKEEIKLDNTEVLYVFRNLLHMYETAFVYCWFHPKIGMWLGATPEHLLKTKGTQFSTMALAGTQPFNGTLDVHWKNKEIQEQRIVTEFLIDTLEPLVENLKMSDTKTVRAGKLLHLQTDVSAQIKNDNLTALLKSLHPTPATCGLPKEEAKSFILDNENYKREYYTGFLGEINIKTKNSRNLNRRNVENNAYISIKNETNLYVNLRCMQIIDNKAILYVGGGITKDSNPESEWQETVNKTQTMKNVLN